MKKNHLKPSEQGKISYLFLYRQFPEHLLCKRDPESLPVKPPEGLDEDEVASSEHSMELLSSPFRTDRYRGEEPPDTAWPLPPLGH